MEIILIPLAVLFLAAMVVAVVRHFQRGRLLSAADGRRLSAQMDTAEEQRDAHRKVLDGEKVLDHALRTLGYRGTFADKLKRAAPRLRDSEAVWRAHRLRNRIAHEAGVDVDGREAAGALRAFRRALEDLCR